MYRQLIEVQNKFWTLIFGGQQGLFNHTVPIKF